MANQIETIDRYMTKQVLGLFGIHELLYILNVHQSIYTKQKQKQKHDKFEILKFCILFNLWAACDEQKVTK